MFDHKIVLDQLTNSNGAGQGRLKSMIGAGSFSKDRNAISFKFKGSKVTNFVKITLTGADDYILEFYKIPTTAQLTKMSDDEYDEAIKPVKTFKRIGAENLKSTFEKFTKLRTSL